MKKLLSVIVAVGLFGSQGVFAQDDVDPYALSKDGFSVTPYWPAETTMTPTTGGSGYKKPIAFKVSTRGTTTKLLTTTLQYVEIPAWTCDGTTYTNVEPTNTWHDNNWNMKIFGTSKNNRVYWAYSPFKECQNPTSLNTYDNNRAVFYSADVSTGQSCAYKPHLGNSWNNNIVAANEIDDIGSNTSGTASKMPDGTKDVLLTVFSSGSGLLYQVYLDPLSCNAIEATPGYAIGSPEVMH